MKLGEDCGIGIHRDEPTDTEKASDVLKSFEGEHGTWDKSMVGKKPKAAPAKNKGNAICEAGS